MDIEKSKDYQWEKQPSTSALLSTLLELLKKEDPELWSPALRMLKARRECSRFP